MNKKSKGMLIGMSIGTAVGGMTYTVFGVVAIPVCVSLGISIGTLCGSITTLK